MSNALAAAEHELETLQKHRNPQNSVLSTCENTFATISTPTSAHPDSAYGASPAMKWAVLTNEPNIPEVEYSDNWRYEILPQDLLITPQTKMFKPYILSANVGVHDQPFMSTPTNDHLSGQIQPQHDALAPWQIWDMQDNTPPLSSFSLFSPTNQFVSVFDQQIPSIRNSQNSDKDITNNSLQESAGLRHLNIFPFTSPTAEEPSYGDKLETQFYQRKRQRSNIMSPLTTQFSSALASFDSASTSFSPTISKTSYFDNLIPTTSSSSSTSKSLKTTSKVRKDKDGKDTKCFPCDMCNSTFSRNHDLKRHVRIHLGIRPYKCDTCPKSFTRMDALNRHKNIRGCKGALEDDGNEDE